jgi:hypothetical protein
MPDRSEFRLVTRIPALLPLKRTSRPPDPRDLAREVGADARTRRAPSGTLEVQRAALSTSSTIISLR